MSEIYVGVKFFHEKISETFPAHILLPELKKACTLFAEKNWAPAYPGGSAGNLSFRAEKGGNAFYITASHTGLRKNMPDTDFCFVESWDLEKFRIEYSGARVPSSESLMHGEIYRLRPEISVVLHGHSDEILHKAALLSYPTTRNEAAYGTFENVQELAQIVHRGNLLILKNHGFVSLGNSLDEALENITKVFGS